jgi:sugar phosphate isomerase/epimerase
MKIGVCQKDLHAPLQETLGWMAENGFDGFQVWKGRIKEDGLSAGEVRTMAADLGLEVSAVGGGPNLVNPALADEVVDLFRGFLELSVELGPGVVTAESKAKPPELSDEEAWKSTAQTVARICDHAVEVGAVLAIECAGPCFISDHERWERLSREVGSASLKVNYDPANIVWARRDPVEGAEALSEHIVHTHAKDILFVKSGGNEGQQGVRDVPAGEGLVDYPGYLAVLREAGYDGYLTIEMHVRGGERRGEILRAAANLRGMLEGV